jgi:hypothetical protein
MELKLGTAVNCNKEGHCLHEGTAVGSLYCCKCGTYMHQDREYIYSLAGQGYRLMAKENLHLAEESMRIVNEVWSKWN